MSLRIFDKVPDRTENNEHWHVLAVNGVFYRIKGRDRAALRSVLKTHLRSAKFDSSLLDSAPPPVDSFPSITDIRGNATFSQYSATTDDVQTLQFTPDEVRTMLTNDDADL